MSRKNGINKSPNTRSMIFTLYGDYISHYGHEIWIGSLIRLLQEFGHNEQSVRAAISRMNKQGWVEAHKKGNRSHYRLTDRGMRRIQEAAQRIFKFQTESWDGKWRMLMYTIPEEKRQIRDELRKEMVWSGFGMLANGLWISPNPLEEQVHEMIEKYQIASYVHFFVNDYQGPHTNQELVEDCWDLDEINGQYEQFINFYSRKYVIDKRKIEQGEMTDGDCFVARGRLVHEYRKFLFIDPGLPKELLPDQWLGGYASSLFGDYYETLAAPASRFFEQVFRQANELPVRPQDDNPRSVPFIIHSH